MACVLAYSKIVLTRNCIFKTFLCSLAAAVLCVLLVASCLHAQLCAKWLNVSCDHVLVLYGCFAASCCFAWLVFSLQFVCFVLFFSPLFCELYLFIGFQTSCQMTTVEKDTGHIYVHRD